MTRAEFAYLLILLLFAVGGTAVFLTRRFKRYSREIARGKRLAKPVRKPFWL